ncbi:MAG TPA: HemK2/MTQ2 family protein methyltransferase [Solirubrobacteraceae bacterium]|nr:HemK2/MTQ2 family protein methyltransferase [Solirubrobacteraceae bacterium]
MRLVPVPGVFQPISDSWMLAGQLRGEAPAGRTVLDLCTGSGMLAVTAALEGAARAVAVDVSRRALLSARLNAAVNGVRVHTLRGDLFDPVAGQRFDLIVSNPPYVPGPADRVGRAGPARAWEGGPDGRVFIDRICSGAPGHLKPGGAVLFVQSTICGEEESLEQLRRGGLQADVVFRHVGALGPRMRQRANWLRHAGLLSEERDEVIVVRGRA